MSYFERHIDYNYSVWVENNYKMRQIIQVNKVYLSALPLSDLNCSLEMS